MLKTYRITINDNVKYPLVLLYLNIHFILIGNVARGKPATQIGTYLFTRYVITADRDVDGNTNPGVFNNSCVQFDSPSLNISCWWYVDLGDVYRITQVILYNRLEEYWAGKIYTVK